MIYVDSTKGAQVQYLTPLLEHDQPCLRAALNIRVLADVSLAVVSPPLVSAGDELKAATSTLSQMQHHPAGLQPVCAAISAIGLLTVDWDNTQDVPQTRRLRQCQVTFFGQGLDGTDLNRSRTNHSDV